jgi:ribonucleoside-triphosphate reductase
VTINANRAALEADNDIDEYLYNLISYAELATDVLLLRKDHILKAFDNGLMPYSKEYIGKLTSFFLTHGLTGVYDGYMNMDIDIPYIDFAERTIKALRAYSKHLSNVTDWQLWNLEQTPMEGGAYRLAKADRQYYPDCYVGGDDDNIYLTNSTHLPVDNNVNIVDEIVLRSHLDRMYTGGTLFNYHANEYASPEAVKDLVRNLCVNTTLPYIAYTPTFGVCTEHGETYGSGVCSTCGNPIDVYSRVVGYIRPTSKFNIGQLQQFKNRKYHTVDIGEVF